MATLDPRLPTSAPGEPVSRRLAALRLALHAAGIAMLALYLVGFVQRNAIHQGDLWTYLRAGQAVRVGFDPYAPASLEALAGRRLQPFVYPAVTLPAFSALSTLPKRTAEKVWMWGKIALLAALVLWAWRALAPRAGPLPIALVAVFGWNSSSLWDLSSGNVALLECVLLWAAFACWLAERRRAFAALVVAAACFKVAPAAFLLLLLAPSPRGTARPGLLVLSLAALAALVAGPLVLGPAAHWDRFWQHLPDASAYGDSNPSGLGLLLAAAARLGLAGEAAARTALVAFVAFALALLAAGVPFLRRAIAERDSRRLVAGAVFLFVLLSPRPMAYGFTLLTPAAFVLAPGRFRGATGALLLALMLSAQGFSRLAYVVSGSLAFVYAPFLLALCLWLLAVSETRGAAAGDAGIAEAGEPVARAAA